MFTRDLFTHCVCVCVSLRGTKCIHVSSLPLSRWASKLLQLSVTLFHTREQMKASESEKTTELKKKEAGRELVDERCTFVLLLRVKEERKNAIHHLKSLVYLSVISQYSQSYWAVKYISLSLSISLSSTAQLFTPSLATVRDAESAERRNNNSNSDNNNNTQKTRECNAKPAVNLTLSTKRYNRLHW